MLTARMLGPSALQRFDQPRTVSYTADVVLEGRWLIPRDMNGYTATKPPLVNWMAAPLVAAGVWTEFAAKFPMLLGSLITLGLTVWMAHRLFQQTPELQSGPDGGGHLAWDAACVAGIAWLVNQVNLTMIYHCRPDPVLTAFLTGAWILGTYILTGPAAPSLRLILGFWLCVGLAAFTKGPAALVPVLFLPLAAKAIGGRWSLANRSRWWWGFPLAISVLLAWAVPCMIFYPEPFWEVLVGREMVAQAAGLADHFGNTRMDVPSEGPIAALKTLDENPRWFVERYAPWSLSTIGGLIAIGWRRWFRHPLAPAVVWFFVVLLFFTFSARKTADYILSCYPAASAIAAYFCVTTLRRRLGVQPWHVATVGFLFAVGLAANAMFLSTAAKDGGGEHLKTFAREAQAVVGDDAVAFVRTGDNTLKFFMHRSQPGDATPEEIARAQWVITPLLPGQSPAAELVSPPMTTKRVGKSLTLALYRAEAVRGQLGQGKTKRE